MEAVSHSSEGTSLAATTTKGKRKRSLFSEDFKAILDEPFMLLNRVAGEYFGEVVLSGDEVVDRSRVQRVIDAAAEKGQSPYAAKHGKYETILIFFTAKEDGLGGA
jgi:hypothetical protein